MARPAEQGWPAANGAVRGRLSSWAPFAGAAWCIAHAFNGPLAFSHHAPPRNAASSATDAVTLRKVQPQAVVLAAPSASAPSVAASRSAWGGAAGLLAVAALLTSPRKGGRRAGALRGRPSSLLLARPASTGAGSDGPVSTAPAKDEQPAQASSGPDASAVAVLAFAAVAAAVAADPATAADVTEAASGAAQVAAGAAAGAADAAVAAADAAAPAVAEAAGSAPAVAEAAAGAAADTAAADAAVDAAANSGGGDWFDPWVNFNAGIISGIDEVIEVKLNLPNTFGFAIIFYTAVVKLLTFPLNQSSLRSNAMMQLLQPKIQQINSKYKNDEETKNRMMLRLFDDCGVNPLGGCLPALVQFPIFIGLYRAINRLAEKNVHFKEPFLWIPSLAGPVEIGKPSVDWLIKSKYEDHFEPLIGWEDAGRFVILPIALVASQYFTQKMSAPQQSQAQGPLGAAVGLIPLVIGYTTLVSPAGLGIYWFMNNVFTQVQTQLIRNGLSEEFPEYKKILDGTAEKEKAERQAAKEAEEAYENRDRGFGAVAPEPTPAPAAEIVEGGAPSDDGIVDTDAAPVPAPTPATPVRVPKYDPEKAAERRARRRRSQSKRRRR